MRGRVRLAVGLCKGGCVSIGEVEIVGKLRMLRGYRWDALHRGQDAFLLAVYANGQILLLHVSAGRFQNEACNLEVGESTLLYLQQQRVRQVFQTVVLHQLVLQVDNMLQTLQEPLVNLG